MKQHQFGNPIVRYGSIRKMQRLLTVISALAVSAASHAEAGVTPKEILIGTVTNLKRKSAGVGEEFNAGITAYINKINKHGGIFGRKIKRVMYNDSYDPEETLRETRRLVDKDKVFALTGFGSTPGVKRILPLVESKKIPVIAPFSGGNFLRDGRQKYVFNIKAGYTDQVEALTKLGVYSMGFKDVCVFDQDDSIGSEAREAADQTLQKYNLKLLAHAEYERNSLEIHSAFTKLKDAGCKAIVMAAQDRQTLAFISAAHSAGFHPLYLCLNLIATDLFLSSVRDMAERIFVTVVTPLPSETAYPIVREFRKELASLNPKARFTSVTLEGYLVGAILEATLQRAGKNLTRAGLMNAFESLKDTNIGGINFTFNRANRQATNHVLITKAEGKELVLLP